MKKNVLRKPTLREYDSALKHTIWQRDELVKENKNLYKIIEILVQNLAKGLK